MASPPALLAGTSLLLQLYLGFTFLSLTVTLTAFASSQRNDSSRGMLLSLSSKAFSSRVMLGSLRCLCRLCLPLLCRSQVTLNDTSCIWLQSSCWFFGSLEISLIAYGRIPGRCGSILVPACGALHQVNARIISWDAGVVKTFFDQIPSASAFISGFAASFSARSARRCSSRTIFSASRRSRSP